jgi:Flp pilus assembly secretin CpaC
MPTPSGLIIMRHHRLSSFRAAASSAAAGLLLLGALAAPALANERIETVPVVVDHAKVIRLPERTQTVIVGNPAIADVSVQRNGVLVITGKAFGVTNLIALDAAGAMLAESRVSVRAAGDSVMTVHRGTERESYSCAPQCQPVIQLGDANKFFSEAGSQTQTRNAMSVGGQR